MESFASAPRVISPSEHGISERDISAPALKCLRRLHEAGYQACLVGGGVRDLLLGRHPKDFDLATNATPEEIAGIFRSCRLIGRRFRLAHVHFGRHFIEIATFRGPGDGDRSMRDGRLVRDNVYGSIEQDALRRDFTVNALFYDIADGTVKDFVGGYEDVLEKKLRVIGDPAERYREDPVRLIRAVRIAAKLGLHIEAASAEPMAELGELLADISPARLYEESLKLFMAGHASRSFEGLCRFDLFGRLFPETQAVLSMSEDPGARRVLDQAMANTDARIAQHKPVTPAFLFAVLLWEPVRRRIAQLEAEGMAPIDAAQTGIDEVVRAQVRRTAIPRRFSFPMRDIWYLQPRLERRRPRTIKKILENKRFRAAYDFLLLRTEQEPELSPIADWWTEIQELSPSELHKKLGRKRGPRRDNRSVNDDQSGQPSKGQ